jgi:ribonuclease HII
MAKAKEILDNSFDMQFIDATTKFIAGIDEAGRGPLAGPVVTAAVILPDDFDNKIGINDSKKIKESLRDEMAILIKEQAIAYSIDKADIQEIEEKNILQATISSMRRSVSALNQKPDFLLVDGNYFPVWKYPHQCIKKGDSISLSIAAASILAKTTRDEIMVNYAAKEYPEYKFEKHKGYATKEHYQMIDKYGICPYHRPGFLKKYFAEKNRITLL